MYGNFNNDDFIDDDFDMIDDTDVKSDQNNFTSTEYATNDMIVDNGSNVDYFDGSSLSNLDQNIENNSIQSSDFLTQDSSNTETSSFDSNIQEQNNSINNGAFSPLESMYDEKLTSSYEEELKTARPFESDTLVESVEEKPKEVTYSDDFMDYDPLLHNDLQTDGNYTITEFDPNKTNDFVPEQTNFSSEDVMEYYSEENEEKEKPKEPVQEEKQPEVFNTSGMEYDTNNVDTFNDGKTPTETVVTRFIFNDMDNGGQTPMDETAGRQDIGAISVYNKKDSKEKTPTRKALEMVGTILIFAIIILIISFFPDINKIFDNLRN